MTIGKIKLLIPRDLVVITKSVMFVMKEGYEEIYVCNEGMLGLLVIVQATICNEGRIGGDIMLCTVQATNNCNTREYDERTRNSKYVSTKGKDRIITN
jgi:hypothetical protein